MVFLGIGARIPTRLITTHEPPRDAPNSLSDHHNLVRAEGPENPTQTQKASATGLNSSVLSKLPFITVEGFGFRWPQN